jgi:DNA-binding CsgD family transcriptional regulator
MLMTQYDPAAVAEQCQAALRLPGVPLAVRVQLQSLLACGLDISGRADAAAGPVADAIAEAAASGDPAAEIVTFVPRALLAFAQGDWRGAIDLASEAVTRQHEAKDLGLWLPETWKSLLLISELRLDEAHAIIEAGTREAENIFRNVRVWSMLRCRARLSAGQLADARAEAEAILNMSDEIGDEYFGYLNHIARYALSDVALRTGDPVALQAARRNAAAMYHTTSGCGITRRLGAWLTVRLDGGPIGPDLLDVLAPGHVHACSPLAHSDTAELVRLLLAAGQRSDAASVTALLEQAASTNPGFPGLASAALHARALADEDPERAQAAARDYQSDPRPLVRAAAVEDAGRLLPERAKGEAVGYLDEALRLQSAAGAERDAARVRRLLRDRGVQRAGGRPDPAAARWPELTSSELAVVRLVTQGATDREVAERLFISVHTVNSHLRHVFAKLGIRSRVELARRAGERQPELPLRLLEQARIGVHESPRRDRLLPDHAAEGIWISLGQAARGVDAVGLVDEQRTAAVRERTGRRQLTAFQQPVQVGAVSGPDRRNGALVLDIADVVRELHGPSPCPAYITASAPAAAPRITYPGHARRGHPGLAWPGALIT